MVSGKTNQLSKAKTMNKYENMSVNQRESLRDSLHYSLSFKNRNEAPVWLRMELYKGLGHEAPFDGDNLHRK